MRAAIDGAGHPLFPGQRRNAHGLRTREVAVGAYGAGLRIEPTAGAGSHGANGGRPVIPATGIRIDDSLECSPGDAGQQ